MIRKSRMTEIRGLTSNELRKIAYAMDNQHLWSREIEKLYLRLAPEREEKKLRREERILYCGHYPKKGEKYHEFFEDIPYPENSDHFTNMKVGGKLPFMGSYAITGIGMIVHPITNIRKDKFNTIIDGYFDFCIRNTEMSIGKLPLHTLYSQGMEVKRKTEKFQFNNPFIGETGFLRLSTTYRIFDITSFNICVKWRKEWEKNSNTGIWLYIIGVKETEWE